MEQGPKSWVPEKELRKEKGVTMARLTIYVEQYGFFWSFTPKQFLVLVGRYIKTKKPFNWGKSLKSPPYQNVARYHRGEGHFHSTSSDVILFHPLDWDKGDYTEAFREVYQRMLKEQRKRK